jgi:hypothetical protein
VLTFRIHHVMQLPYNRYLRFFLVSILQSCDGASHGRDH